MKWSIGVLESWSTVIQESKIVPLLDYSITPFLRVIFCTGLATALFSLLALLPGIAEACPGCNAAMDNTVGRGFNMSVLFLMGMPFFVFGTLAFGIFFVRRNLKNHNSNSTQINQHNQTEEREI